MNPMLAEVVRVTIVVALGVVAVFGGSPIVQKVFGWVDRTPATKPVPGANQPSAAAPEASPGVQAAAANLRGGHWIGLLERLSMYAAVLAGFPEGIAVALAIKGLARYPELTASTPGSAERFIIGTFTSVLVAVGCAGLAWWLIGLV